MAALMPTSHVVECLIACLRSQVVARNIMAKERFKEAELDADAEYDYDGGLELYESKSKKGEQRKAVAIGL